MYNAERPSPTMSTMACIIHRWQMFWFLMLLSLSISTALKQDHIFSVENPAQNALEKYVPGTENLAVYAAKLLRDKFSLVLKKYPITSKFVERLAREGTALISEHPGYIAASIILGVLKIIRTSCQLVNEASVQLLEAQFYQDELNMMMLTEIYPILESTEMVLNEGTSSTAMKQLCGDQNLFRPFKGKLDNAIAVLRAVRKDIEKKLLDLDNAGVFRKAWRYFSEDDDVQRSLYTQARSKSLEAEAFLRQARSQIDNVCMQLMMIATEEAQTTPTAPTSPTHGLWEMTEDIYNQLLNKMKTYLKGVRFMRTLPPKIARDEL